MSAVTIGVGKCPSCGELWPACACGKATPPEVLDHMEPEPAESFVPLVEWVQWKGKRGELSLYHVRVTSGGWLLCGRKAGASAAADSFPPVEQKCAICLGKLAS